jgi:23S rRNA G2069 N7-methylase RlmK/C1962 C5-methylase RlmI
MVSSDFENRLARNAKHRVKWAERQGLTAYRLYDLDIPEWPFAVDRYGEFVHVMEYPRRKALRDGVDRRSARGGGAGHRPRVAGRAREDLHQDP